ncbi:single-stranded-DNA-specific exonuclease RecJ [secondary endosymbiont of Ctenarytaina eucalypti]|uniref:Single-stranded-DNA-specific exonuclease RecJ n=1 Tax=secondary endosymbiont of Ctenarytaina eucalypti TaxID=1199245 RepID=J3VRC3_9ENTR|nr:single-stranded-DNA-specific exonuclease RecJ [secondary endosymbiont of Ctenarytaina eucalypti]AFP84496.1 single-stranded-DNA-specific exonuclease RecJ [secondary endosymbiont of Ctenarytaina eucalypti]
MTTPVLRRRPLGKIDVLRESEIPPLLKRLYLQRGVCALGELERGVRGLLPYHQLTGIEQATDLLVGALVNQCRIMVIGDFDADGATSTALTVLALRKMGARKVDFLVPNRFKDGYGLSPEIVEQAAARGAQFIVTVDNGISSHEGVVRAHHKGIRVLITDHHLPSDTLPTADAILNPNLHGCTFASKSLSGVGVAFYLMLSLRARLNDGIWFTQRGIAAPKLAELLDLVALGTVVDVVPMDANNRILVHQGLNRIRAGQCRPGIQALAELTNGDLTQLRASDLAFRIGPRLNAAGRLTDMSVGVLLLLTDEISQARILATKLNALNKARRQIEQGMEAEALALCQAMSCDENTMPCGLAIYHAQWHQGVVGILASRIKERFQRPVIAFAPAGDGILKGSGRSIPGLHMRDLLERLNTLHPNLMLQFGGHGMAAGLMLKQTQFDRFQEDFSTLVEEWIDPAMLEGVIWSDGELSGPELSVRTAELLREGGPWGQTFPEPLFDGRFRVIHQKLMGDKHLKLLLEPLAGGPILDGVAFNIDSHLWPNPKVNTLELAYRLEVNNFFGNRRLQLFIEHIWPLS